MTAFQSEVVWRPQGRGFSMGRVQGDGQVIHLTGQVAWDAEQMIVGDGDVEAQTRQCFRNIAALLDEVGGELSDIVSLTTWYTAQEQLPLIQKVRAETFSADAAPVSTSVMVAGLGHPDFLVELTPIAVVPPSRFRQPS